MRYRGTIGAITFELERAGAVRVPPLDARPAPTAEYGTLFVVAAGDEIFLVLDHREDPADGAPAYVEFWRPLSAGEGSLVGMFVLSSGAAGREALPAPPSVATLHTVLPIVG